MVGHRPVIVTRCPRPGCRAMVDGSGPCCSACWELIPVTIRADLEDGPESVKYGHAWVAAVRALQLTKSTSSKPAKGVHLGMVRAALAEKRSV